MKLLLRWIPVIAAACCILAALLPLWVRRGRMRKPVDTQAVIISNVTQRVYRNRSEITAIAPVLSFMTPQGEVTVTGKRFVPEWQYRYQNGETLRICYDAEDPRNYYIYHDRAYDWRTAALLTAGLGTLAAYAVLWLRY